MIVPLRYVPVGCRNTSSRTLFSDVAISETSFNSYTFIDISVNITKTQEGTDV